MGVDNMRWGIHIGGEGGNIDGRAVRHCRRKSLITEKERRREEISEIQNDKVYQMGGVTDTKD